MRRGRLWVWVPAGSGVVVTIGMVGAAAWWRGHDRLDAPDPPVPVGGCQPLPADLWPGPNVSFDEVIDRVCRYDASYSGGRSEVRRDEGSSRIFMPSAHGSSYLSFDHGTLTFVRAGGSMTQGGRCHGTPPPPGAFTHLRLACPGRPLRGATLTVEGGQSVMAAMAPCAPQSTDKHVYECDRPVTSLQLVTTDAKGECRATVPLVDGDVGRVRITDCDAVTVLGLKSGDSRPVTWVRSATR